MWYSVQYSMRCAEHSVVGDWSVWYSVCNTVCVMQRRSVWTEIAQTLLERPDWLLVGVYVCRRE